MDKVSALLRKKIDDAYELKLIQTVRGMGYLLDFPDAVLLLNAPLMSILFSKM